MGQIPEWLLIRAWRDDLLARLRERLSSVLCDLLLELDVTPGESGWVRARLAEIGEAIQRVEERWRDTISGLDRMTLLVSQPLPLRI